MLKTMVEKKFGGSITQAEYRKAKTAAQRKLKWIISRYGDLDGERLKPYYFVALISEAIRSERLTRFCNMNYEVNEEARRHHTNAPQPT